MPKLILIKHASPLVVPGKPPEQWRLSDQGRESCGPLAEKLRGHQPAVVVSSVEPKAIETAEFVAASLGVSHHTAPGLHEHDRSNVPHMRSGEFISMMELFFRRPDELVLGKETASEALARFSKAVDAVVSQHADQTIAIVSHGTVIALLLAKHANKPPFQLWRELGLPSFAVLELPEYSVSDVINKV